MEYGVFLVKIYEPREAGHICVPKLVWKYVYMNVDEHMGSCVLLSMLSYCMHSSVFLHVQYILHTRQMAAARVRQRPEPCCPDREYKPNKCHETCRVQLWSEVNTCLCWHKQTLNRCVFPTFIFFQIWEQIVVGSTGKNDMRTNSYIIILLGELEF